MYETLFTYHITVKMKLLKQLIQKLYTIANSVNIDSRDVGCGYTVHMHTDAITNRLPNVCCLCSYLCCNLLGCFF